MGRPKPSRGILGMSPSSHRRPVGSSGRLPDEPHISQVLDPHQGAESEASILGQYSPPGDKLPSSFREWIGPGAHHIDKEKTKKYDKLAEKGRD